MLDMPNTAPPADFSCLPAIAAAVAAGEASPLRELQTAARPLHAEARRHLAAVDGFRALAAAASRAGEADDEDALLRSAIAAMQRAAVVLRRLHALEVAAAGPGAA